MKGILFKPTKSVPIYFHAAEVSLLILAVVIILLLRNIKPKQQQKKKSENALSNC